MGIYFMDKQLEGKKNNLYLLWREVNNELFQTFFLLYFLPLILKDMD